MYIGRIVSVGLTLEGEPAAVYRVSSRSFPNRTAVVGTDKVSIVPKTGHESDIQKNPYIAYNCVRVVCDGRVAVVTNGSHTDAVAEKIDSGMGVRDAVALASLTLDFEKDAYDTPRISAVIDRRDGSGWLGVVRRDGLEVRRMPIEAGRLFYVATYEENGISLEQSDRFDATEAKAACAYILGKGVFALRTHAVAGVAAVGGPSGFELASMDAAQP